MQDCYTFIDYYNILGSNYNGNPFDEADKMYVMRYTSIDTENLVTRSYGGTSIDDIKAVQDVLGLDSQHTFLNEAPYLGTGVTKDIKNGVGKLELMSIKDISGNPRYCKIEDGSAIYEIIRDKKYERLKAVRINGKWWQVIYDE